MYVALEGIDCVGKSTQISLLKKEFKEAIFTFEPGATELGKHLRELLLKSDKKISKKAELLLFLADRAQHFDELLCENKDRLIISDRSLISGMAYARDFDLELLFNLNSFALNRLLPQKIVFLSIDVRNLKKRLEKKEQDKIEQRGFEYFLEIQNKIKEVLNFLKQKDEKLEILELDASLQKEDICKKIKDFLND